MVPRDVDEMVVDWPELMAGAEGPVDLAMKLQERFQLEGIMDPENHEPLPESLGSETKTSPGEAEFL
jgi:hypothetical protein